MCQKCEETEIKLKQSQQELASERRKSEELETHLRIIGDMAVVDWDDKTVGAVDAIVKSEPSKTYIEKVRNLYKRADDALKAEQELAKLRQLNESLKRDLFVSENTVLASDDVIEVLRQQVEKALTDIRSVTDGALDDSDLNECIKILISQRDNARIMYDRADKHRNELDQQVEELKKVSEKVRDYCIKSPHDILDMPDEIWVPFTKTIDAAIEKERGV